MHLGTTSAGRGFRSSYVYNLNLEQSSVLATASRGSQGIGCHAPRPGSSANRPGNRGDVCSACRDGEGASSLVVMDADGPPGAGAAGNLREWRDSIGPESRQARLQLEDGCRGCRLMVGRLSVTGQSAAYLPNSRNPCSHRVGVFSFQPTGLCSDC